VPADGCGVKRGTERVVARAAAWVAQDWAHAVAVWLRAHSKGARGGGRRTFRCARNIASDLAEALLERGSAATELA
jgi:hypothetical protein